MRKLEIQAYTLDEAKIKAFEEGITVIYDATYRWRMHHKPILSKELELFAAEVLADKGLFDFEGAGLIISVQTGRDNTKLCPSRLINERRKGRCKCTRTIEIRRKDTDEVVGDAPNKTKAIALARELIKEQRADLYAKTVYKTDGIDFELLYNPSTKTHMGQYIVFGVDKADVRISKRKNRGFTG